MNEKRLERDLGRLGDATAEGVREGLAGDIKVAIARGGRPHKRGMDSFNIIIDLRISKLAAAAVIIVTTVLCANFLGRDAGGESLLKDSKMLVRYILGGSGVGRNDSVAGAAKYGGLVRHGEGGVGYAESAGPADSNAVLMHRQLSEGKYLVIYGDFSSETISYDHLLKAGKEIVYYGDSIDAADNNAVLMHWKLSEGKYVVVFSDLRRETIGSEELIKLQAEMLQKKGEL